MELGRRDALAALALRTADHIEGLL